MEWNDPEWPDRCGCVGTMGGHGLVDAAGWEWPGGHRGVGAAGSVLLTHWQWLGMLGGHGWVSMSKPHQLTQHGDNLMPHQLITSWTASSQVYACARMHTSHSELGDFYPQRHEKLKETWKRGSSALDVFFHMFTISWSREQGHTQWPYCHISYWSPLNYALWYIAFPIL